MHYMRSRGMLRRFKSYGLPYQFAKALEAEVIRWEDHSGPKWTVNRLKSLKGDFIRIQAGEQPLTWVKKNRKGGWFGIWGSLRTFAMRSLKHFEIVLNCLMVYSSYIPSRPTSEHCEACRSAIEAKPVFVPEQLKKDLAAHARSIFGDHVSLGSHRPLLTFLGRPGVRSPSFRGTSVPQDSELEVELEWIADPYNSLFLQRHYEVYSRVLEGLDPIAVAEPLMGLSGGVYTLSEWKPFQTVHSKIRPPFMPVPAGHLVPLTKDGGWKVRWIANPYRIHQLALAPLGSALFRLLEDLPWDCTYDQSKPYSIIQEHLRKGDQAFAVDLTSATDYFPLEVQLSVLKAILPEPDVSLFGELSRCRWKSKELGEVRWTVGQPMGLYPSFPSFALSHGLLLHYLSGGRPNAFFVLGDDVVILHRPLYEAYVQALDVLGCPHNPTKSLISKGLTEFAGKIITTERVVSAYKWRDPNSENFMELMRTFGQRFRPLLRPRERRVYDSLASLLPPHGANHSQGASLGLVDAVIRTDEFTSSLPEKCGRVVHTSFLHQLVDYLKPTSRNSLFYKVCRSWARKKTEDLDERSRVAFLDTPFENAIFDRGHLVDILELTNRKIGLPATRSHLNGIGRESTLEFYERVLDFRKN